LQILGHASRQIIQVKRRGPFLPPGQGVTLGFIAKVPDEIDGSGLAIQLALQGLHTVFVGANHGDILSQTKSVLADQEKKA